MQNWIKRLTSPFQRESRKKKTRTTPRTATRRSRPYLDCLEDRTVPATFSSIASNFNGTAIPAGDSVWFNAAFKASGLGAGPVSIHVTNQHISFNDHGTPYNVNVPDSILNFSAANTVATTSFNAGQNAWITNLPMSWSGNAFMGGATFVATNGLKGGINPVTWSGDFAADRAGVQVSWQWGAAVYTQFSPDYNALNVKPLDSNSATVYHNSDHAGTPEAFKSFVIGGARGGGGSNWTGSYSGTRKVTSDLEDFDNDQPPTIAGRVVDVSSSDTSVGLGGVSITLSRYENGNLVVVDTKLTDDDGYYKFDVNLLPGTYVLTNNGKAGFDYAAAHLGHGDGIDDGTVNSAFSIINISLASGENGVEYNFDMEQGEPPPPST